MEERSVSMCWVMLPVLPGRHRVMYWVVWESRSVCMFVLKDVEDDSEVVMKSQPIYIAGVPTAITIPNINETTPTQNAIKQAKYAKYRHQYLSQNPIRQPARTPKTPMPVTTPKNILNQKEVSLTYYPIILLFYAISVSILFIWFTTYDIECIND